LNIPTHLKRVTTLPCPRTEWSELPCKTQPFKPVARIIQPVMLASFCSLTRTYLSWIDRKHTEWLTARTSVNQEERRRDKTPAHTINVCALMTVVDESHVVGITPVFQSRAKVTEEY